MTTEEIETSAKKPASNEQVVKQVLGHLDVSDGFYDAVLVPNRCRSLLKLMNYNNEQREMIKRKVKKLGNEDYEFDLLNLLQMIDAASYHMRVNESKNVYRAETGVDDIENMIMEFELYLREIEETKKVTPSPMAGEVEHASVAGSEVTDGSTEGLSGSFAKRSLVAFKDCNMPSNPITAKDMKSFKVRVKNILRSIDMGQMLDKDYVLPEEGEPGYASYLRANKFLFSVWIDITSNPDHKARNWLLEKEVANDGRKA